MKPFSLYLKEWLYSKNGYYTSMPDIGKNGDFYTSVSTSMFFGGSIANHLLKNIDDGFLSENSLVLEIGAHKGYLLADMIQFIYTLRPKLLKSLKFAVIEPLKSAREAQKEYFNSSFGDEVSVKIVKELKHLAKDEAFIVSNELFDAFTCEVIKDDKMLYMRGHEPIFETINKETKILNEQFGVKKGEIPIGLHEFAKEISLHFKKYKFITFDYGQMEPRGDFSLRVYAKHKVYPFFELTHFTKHSNQLENFFAKSDITYDVCFSYLKDAFEKTGTKMDRFCTQMVALNEFGITDLLEILHKNSDEQTYLKELQKAKQLLLPNFFGERFKMISFTKR